MESPLRVLRRKGGKAISSRDTPDTKQREGTDDQHRPLLEEDDNKRLRRELLLRGCVVRVHERHRKIQHKKIVM